MKEAFDTYFKKLKELSNSVFERNPITIYIDGMNEKIVDSELDEDGYVEWKPVEQENVVDWSRIEGEVGFSLAKELKAYYSVYSFPLLVGRYEDCNFYFYGVNNTETVEMSVLKARRDGEYYFPESQIFLIGGADVGTDDNYFLFYNNKDNSVFCYESETKRQKKVANSIVEIFNLMEAGI